MGFLEDYFKVISKKALCEGGAFDVVFYYGVPILRNRRPVGLVKLSLVAVSLLAP